MAMTLLMSTVPVFIWRANAIALFLSRVHTLADKPNWESLAFSIASAASRTFITGNVGPKVSSLMHFIPWLTSTNTVGW
jgi:hypothetical protein